MLLSLLTKGMSGLAKPTPVKRRTAGEDGEHTTEAPTDETSPGGLQRSKLPLEDGEDQQNLEEGPPTDEVHVEEVEEIVETVETVVEETVSEVKKKKKVRAAFQMHTELQQ